MRNTRARSVRGALLAIMLVVGTVWALPASAARGFHLSLKKSMPAANDTLAVAPTQIHLWFTEKPEVAVSTVELVDAAGTKVAVSKVRADTADATAVIADIRGEVKPGRYTVNWRALASDGHPATGSIPFVVKAAPR